MLLGALAVVLIALAQGGQLTLAGLIGGHGVPSEQEAAVSSAPAPPSLPTLAPVSQDAAGSAIGRASYPSAALDGGEGSFLVYLPAGYDATTSHYPVLYMLTGNDQSDTAFLQIGLQAQLDQLIARHAIPPLIAVMIQGGPGSNNWRNTGSLHYESYILEVQQLIDRMLPTVPARDARAVVGDSMGGYGAMNVALANPYRFGVVESWLSFFNGLEGVLHADRPIFSRLGLHAFIYGGEQDHIANPDEDFPFASALRAAGARGQRPDLPRRTQPADGRSTPRTHARLRRARPAGAPDSAPWRGLSATAALQRPVPSQAAPARWAHSRRVRSRAAPWRSARSRSAPSRSAG